MENQLKPPTQPCKIGEEDMKRVNAFKKLITETAESEFIRKAITHVYVNYTLLLIANPVKIGVETEEELYYLNELIEILE